MYDFTVILTVLYHVVKAPIWHSQKCTDSIFRVQEVLSKNLPGGTEENQKTSDIELVSKVEIGMQNIQIMKQEYYIFNYVQ